MRDCFIDGFVVGVLLMILCNMAINFVVWRGVMRRSESES